MTPQVPLQLQLLPPPVLLLLPLVPVLLPVLLPVLQPSVPLLQLLIPSLLPMCLLFQLQLPQVDQKVAGQKASWQLTSLLL